MFCFTVKKYSFIKRYLTCLSLTERRLLLQNIQHPLIRNIKKNRLLQKIACDNYLHNNDALKLYYKNIKLKRMEDITELSELAEEQKLEKTEEIIMEMDNEYSESEESSEPEFQDSITIEKMPYKKNQYQHSFNINRSYCTYIIGSKGSMLQNLCAETKTTIRVSKKKKHVVIIGSVQKRIIHAKRRINQLIENTKNKLQFTHFISIPLNRDDIKENFIIFKNNILKKTDLNDTGFDEGMFQKPEKLHLTICMLHLLDDSDQEKAILALNNCKKDIIEPIFNQNKQISIELRGLKCMEKNPANARVLYINVQEETGLLQKMSDDINEYFIKEGLSRKQHDKVTLHMTVINTFYLKNKKQKKFKKHFDATDILKLSKDVYLGKINLCTFHLSKLTAKSADGYFEATAKIQL